MIDIKHLSAGYKDMPILKNMTLHVDAGEVVALVGHNGAGKSTLFKTIMGMAIKEKGKVSILGTVAYVPQDTRVFGGLTVIENVLVSSEHNFIPEQLITLFPILEHKKHTRAKSLSGGERQMVALARALINKPDILLLDEPTVGLSPKLVKETFETLVRINKTFNTTMVIIEHNLNSLLAFADRAYVLEKGEVIDELTHKDFKSKDSVYRALVGK